MRITHNLLLWPFIIDYYFIIYYWKIIVAFYLITKHIHEWMFFFYSLDFWVVLFNRMKQRLKV